MNKLLALKENLVKKVEKFIEKAETVLSKLEEKVEKVHTDVTLAKALLGTLKDRK